MNKTLQFIMLAVLILGLIVAIVVGLTYNPDRSVPGTTALESTDNGEP